MAIATENGKKPQQPVLFVRKPRDLRVTAVALDAVEIAAGEEPNLEDVEQTKTALEAIGQIAPIVVIGKNGRYRVIAGRRRVAAMKALGWSKCLAVVRRKATTTPFEEAAIILAENGARRDNPYQEFRALQAVLKRTGVDETGIASVLSRPKPWVSSRLELAKLSDDLLNLFRIGGMNFGTARAASKLTKRQQTKLWALATAGLENGEIPQIGMPEIRAVVGTSKGEMFEEPARDLLLRGRLDRLRVESEAVAAILVEKYGNRYAKLRKALLAATALLTTTVGRLSDDGDASDEMDPETEIAQANAEAAAATE